MTKRLVLVALIVLCFSGARSAVLGLEDSAVLEEVEYDFDQPTGLKSYNGKLYIVDMYNNQILEMNDGQLSIVAGRNDKQDLMGFPLGGYVDGDVDSAYFNRPRDIAVTLEGVIYIADTDNNVIRKIKDGKVTTLAGSGEAGDVDGIGTSAKFNKPSSIEVDSEGNVLVCDMLNNKIRKIDKEGLVTTMQLVSQDQQSHILNEPSSIHLLANGTIIVADAGNHLIKQIKGSEVSVLSGYWNGQLSNGYGEEAYLDGGNKEARYAFPKSITSYDGVVYIADTWNHSIRLIKADGNVVTLAGNGLVGNSLDMSMNCLNGPSGIVVNEGRLYVSDRWNNRLVSYELDYGSKVYDLELEDMTDMDTNQVDVIIDNVQVEYKDVQAMNVNGEYYYPVRIIAETLGMDVDYDSRAKEAVIKASNKVIKYTIEDHRGIIRNNRLMMPIRVLAKDLEQFLSVNEETGDVWISQPSKEGMR